MKGLNEKGSVAWLSSRGELSSFSFAGKNVRFRTSPRLVRYEKVLTWDDGYIEVMADYGALGVMEEYIDLRPILENLFIDSNEFLSPIRKVEVRYESPECS